MVVAEAVETGNGEVLYFCLREYDSAFQQQGCFVEEVAKYFVFPDSQNVDLGEVDSLDASKGLKVDLAVIQHDYVTADSVPDCMVGLVDCLDIQEIGL